MKPAKPFYEQSKAHIAHLRLLKYGNKACKLLSWLTKGPYIPTTIRSLKNKDGKVSSDPKEINEILAEYYKLLYSKDPINDRRAEEFLREISLPKLTEPQLDTLNAPISEDEIKRGLSNLQNRKSPGPNGLTAEYYKALQDELLTPMLKLYNGMWEGKPYFNTGREARIKVLKKKDKEPLEPSSYRPISLINADAKLLSKILAQRLAPIMPTLI